METRRWLNQSQPQMLQNATILLYLRAAFGLLSLNLFSILGAGAGFGIANDKKWGYYLGIVVAVVPLAFNLLALIGLGNLRLALDFNMIIELMFQVLLVALLLHPMSRDYQRIWFK